MSLLNVSYALLVLSAMFLLSTLYYIFTHSLIKTRTYRIGYPISIIWGLINCITAVLHTQYLYHIGFRALNAYVVFTNLLFILLLNIETLSLFRVLEPNLSDMLLTVPRIVSLFLYAGYFVTNLIHYLNIEDMYLDKIAKISRLVYICSLCTFLQMVFLYWIYLVQKTLRQKHIGIIKKRLKRAQRCVFGICFVCITGGAAFGYFESVEYNHPGKGPSLIYTIFCISAAIAIGFMLFSTVIKLNMKSKNTKPTPAAASPSIDPKTSSPMIKTLPAETILLG